MNFLINLVTKIPAAINEFNRRRKENYAILIRGSVADPNLKD